MKRLILLAAPIFAMAGSVVAATSLVGIPISERIGGRLAAANYRV